MAQRMGCRCSRLWFLAQHQGKNIPSKVDEKWSWHSFPWVWILVPGVEADTLSSVWASMFHWGHLKCLAWSSCLRGAVKVCSLGRVSIHLPFFLKKTFIFNYMCVRVHVHVWTQGLAQSERSVGTLRVRVTGSCELLIVGPGHVTQSSGRAVCALNHQTIFPEVSLSPLPLFSQAQEVCRGSHCHYWYIPATC